MKITVIPQDNMMCVDGVWKLTDLSHIDSNIIAIHVTDGAGFAYTAIGLNPDIVLVGEEWKRRDKNPMGGEVTEMDFPEMATALQNYNNIA